MATSIVNNNEPIQNVVNTLYSINSPFIDFSNKTVREEYLKNTLPLLSTFSQEDEYKVKILNAIFESYNYNYKPLLDISEDITQQQLGIDWACIVILNKSYICNSFEKAHTHLLHILSLQDKIVLKKIVIESYFKLIELCSYSLNTKDSDKHILELQEYYEKHKVEDRSLLYIAYALSFYYINFNNEKCIFYIDKYLCSKFSTIASAITLKSLKAKILEEQKKYFEEALILRECIDEHRKFVSNNIPLSYFVQLLNCYLLDNNLSEAKNLITTITKHRYKKRNESESVWGQYYQSKARFHFLNGEYTLALKLIEKSDALVGSTKMAAIKNNLLRAKCLVMLGQRSKAVSEYDILIEAYTNYLMGTQQNLISELEIKYDIKQKEQEVMLLKEIDAYKSRFFSNISHDMRTPISLIIAPLEICLANTIDATQSTNLQLAYRNAKQLESFLEQLLELNKIDAGVLKLRYNFGNVVHFFHDTTRAMELERSIQFFSAVPVEEQTSFFAPDPLYKITQNLISNALKFSNKTKDIKVKLSLQDKAFHLSVQDFGIGMSNSHIDKIFDRFFQIENLNTIQFQGSGIGLSIVKEYVNLLGGTIAVKSKLNKGTTISITFPQKLQLAEGELAEDYLSLQKERVNNIEKHVDVKESFKEKKERDTVLLIEDNEELRVFLKTQLEDSYNIIEANNGREGWSKIKKHLPSLIVSDIMMPELDGISLCKMLKEERNTNHIPIILLSAKTSNESEVEGYGAKADAYVKKPFNVNVLKANINTLILNRTIVQKQVINAFRNNLTSQLDLTTNDSFIRQFFEIIETNIFSTIISIDWIAQEMKVNRATLFRKVKHFTGKKPIEIISQVRLNTAKLLLEKKDGTVKDIAYKLGYKNLDNFYKSYKKQFGTTPTGTSKNKDGTS